MELRLNVAQLLVRYLFEARVRGALPGLLEVGLRPVQVAPGR